MTPGGIPSAAARRARIDQQRQAEHKRRTLHTGAHTMQPIKDPAILRGWMDVASQHDAEHPSGASWYLLLLIGFNTGLRIGDIVSLRVGEIRGHDRLIRLAQKTRKETSIKIRPSVRAAIDQRLAGRDPDEFVFPSRADPSRKERCMNRGQAYKIIRAIADRAGYRGRVGCHTMRKTYAYQLYQASGRNLSLVQYQLGHSSEAVTLKYIGLTQEVTDEAIDKMPVIT